MDFAMPAGRPQLVITAGPGLTPGAEGLAIHPARGLLAVSSQGSDSFAIYDIRPPFALPGTFAIGTNVGLGIDAVSETDGPDLRRANLGGPYAGGLLVVQDEHKRLPHGPQNFERVTWRAVEQVLQQQR